ncbi:hypothetical protein D3C87_1033180 [compost metagenome]
MKLVKPDTVVSTAPTARDGSGSLGLGGNSRRCARNTSVNTPTMPATVWADSTRNSSVPITVPTSPNGTRNLSSERSKSRRNAARPSRSMSSSSGIRIAAACGTVTASAIIGTASDPNPAPKPLLLMPSSSTAGTATA